MRLYIKSVWLGVQLESILNNIVTPILEFFWAVWHTKGHQKSGFQHK